MVKDSFFTRLAECLTADRGRLLQMHRRLARQSDIEAAKIELDIQIEASIAAAQVRKTRCPVPVLDDTLPVSAKRDEIIALIEKHQVIIVCGETGSGKTTQLPLLCLMAGRGIRGLIGHTQPRRIAARTIAQRIAFELHEAVGQSVGYQVRFADHTSPDGYIKIMTDGILLAETHSDPWLSKYDTIIIDEAHERSLNIDFLLGFLKPLLLKRRDLKVIITSATIDAERFSKHFNQAPIIEVSGRLYPVEIRYRPLEKWLETKKTDLSADVDDQLLLRAIGETVDEALSERQGDILVFLPGEREIREAADYLRGRVAQHTRILPLYARQSSDEQRLVFERLNATKIVLATNVAETSLTVPGIRYVIDSGVARIKRYNYRQKVEQLQIERISQASANQRAGRCGRVASGICFRLYDEQAFLLRPMYTDPEILRSSLAGVILRMRALRLGHIEAFPFIDAPWPKMIAEGYRLLYDIGALDRQKKLTPIGRQIAQLPLDPKIARILLAGAHEGCLSDMLIICAALSVQDPRERPVEMQAAADTAHRRFFEPKSEFASWLRLWKHMEQWIQSGLSRRKLAEQCKKEFLSYLRIREWRDVHQQLTQLVQEADLPMNTQPATLEQISNALLTGFLGHIGYRSEDGDGYVGANGLRFWIHPSSLLKKKQPKWIIAAELTETSRLFARCVCEIQPEWIERAAEHLIKRQYEDPHWLQSQGKVMAYERVVLYGMTIVAKRLVHYGPIDPKTARSVFIRSALVEGNFATRAPFWAHNQALIKKVEVLEHKSRRPNILVDDEVRYAFYDQRIPEDITQQVTFDQWRKTVEAQNPKLLFFTEQDLMRREAAEITHELYPAKLKMDDITYTLSYWHEPGSFRDGVTLTLPQTYLNRISPIRCEWLTPGLLKEKVLFLCKSLPQRIRATLIPLPAFVDGFMEAMWAGMFDEYAPLTAAIAAFAKSARQADIPETALRIETLPEHLQMNYKVIDESGRQLAMSRDFEALRAEYAQDAVDDVIDVPFDMTARVTSWSFGDLPEQITVTMRSGRKKRVHPALLDLEDSVRLTFFDTETEAVANTRQGLIRLLIIRLKEQARYLIKNLAKNHTLCAKFSSVAKKNVLETRFLESVFEACFLEHPWPRTAHAFETRVNQGRSRLATIGTETERLLTDIMVRYTRIMQILNGWKGFASAIEDIRTQLDNLITDEFWTDVAWPYLRHYPRYLEAIERRIERLQANASRDQKWQKEIDAVQKYYQQALVRTANPDALISVRWAIEELRVSLFAQELKTAYPVSVKRIEKMIDAV